MKKKRAYCIRCDAEGPVGERCDTPVCRREGYAYVPSEYCVPLKDKPKAVIDPRIGQLFGDFVLVERLSRSVFGKVYLALQRPILMKAAVKVLEPRSGGDEPTAEALRDRFLAEGRALGSLDHPNIVRLLKYGADTDPPYLAMEFVEGVQTLGEALKVAKEQGQEKLAAATIRSVLEQTLWALSDAHGRGIVHLDLSPENVALTSPTGYRDFVRLLDWGLAELEEDEGEPELAMGRVEYIAPERLTGGETGPWTDLYAVAVMAFHLLAGKSIFKGLDRDTIAEKKQDPAYNPAADLDETRYPPFVLKFFQTALAHDPKERHRNAEEFLARLRSVIGFFEG